MEKRYTYEEKYSKCNTIEELMDKHWYDERAINELEEYGVCERAYEKRYKELLILERLQRI